MIDLSVVELLRTLPRCGDAAGSGPAAAPRRPPAWRGDSVALSDEGRRLQMESQIRAAVLGELRLLARAAAAARGTGEQGAGAPPAGATG